MMTKNNWDASKRGWKYTVGEWDFLHNDEWKTAPIEDWPKLIYSNEEIYVDPKDRKEISKNNKIKSESKSKDNSKNKSNKS